MERTEDCLALCLILSLIPSVMTKSEVYSPEYLLFLKHMSERQYLSGSVRLVGVVLIRPKAWLLPHRNQKKYRPRKKANFFYIQSCAPKPGQTSCRCMLWVTSEVECVPGNQSNANVLELSPH